MARFLFFMLIFTLPAMAEPNIADCLPQPNRLALGSPYTVEITIDNNGLITSLSVSSSSKTLASSVERAALRCQPYATAAGNYTVIIQPR